MNSVDRPLPFSPKRGRLLFEWPPRTQLHLGFPFFLILAVLIHAAAVFSLGIRYPSGQTPPLRPAEVFLAGESGGLIPGLPLWLRSEDPALIAPGREDYGLPAIEAPASHTPSFDLVAPEFMEGPAEAQAPRFGNALAEMSRPVPSSRLKSALPANPAPAPRMVEVARLSNDGNDLRIDSAPLESAEARPSLFLARVGGDGKVREVFLVRGSGNARADAARAARIRKAAEGSADREKIVWIEMASELQNTENAPVSP